MSMLEQTEQAKTEKIRIEKDLKEAKIEHLAKLSEKERVHREQRIAKTVRRYIFIHCVILLFVQMTSRYYYCCSMNTL